MTEPAEPEPERRGRTIGVVAAMLVLGIIVPVAGFAFAWKSCAHPAMHGRVDVAGSTLGSWRAPLGRCAATNTVIAPGSGEVELGRTDDDRTLVRYTQDPIDGAVLTLYALSGDRTLTLRGRDCAALASTLRRTNADDAPTPIFDGKLSGTCPIPGGGTVTIDVWWRDCD